MPQETLTTEFRRSIRKQFARAVVQVPGPTMARKEEEKKDANVEAIEHNASAFQEEEEEVSEAVPIAKRARVEAIPTTRVTKLLESALPFVEESSEVEQSSEEVEHVRKLRKTPEVEESRDVEHAWKPVPTMAPEAEDTSESSQTMASVEAEVGTTSEEEASTELEIAPAPKPSLAPWLNHPKPSLAPWLNHED